MTTLLIGLIVVGIILITLEIFLPGGILGILAAICFIAAVVIAFREGEDSTLGLITLGGVLCIGMAYLFFFTVVLPQTKMGQRFSLQTNIDGKGTNDSHDLLYREGITMTDLRPGGIARIDGDRIDVVAVVGYLAKGTAVRVVEIDGSRISVQELPAGSAEPTGTTPDTAPPDPANPVNPVTDLPQF